MVVSGLAVVKKLACEAVSQSGAQQPNHSSAAHLELSAACRGALQGGSSLGSLLLQLQGGQAGGRSAVCLSTQSQAKSNSTKHLQLKPGPPIASTQSKGMPTIPAPARPALARSAQSAPPAQRHSVPAPTGKQGEETATSSRAATVLSRNNSCDLAVATG